MAGYDMNKQELLARLRRVEGQVRGIAQLVEDDRYCIDVLTQVSAATKGLQGVAVGLFDDHLRHCVADAVAEGSLRYARTARHVARVALVDGDPGIVVAPAGRPRVVLFLTITGDKIVEIEVVADQERLDRVAVVW